MSKDDPMDSSASAGDPTERPWAARGRTLLLEPDTAAEARSAFFAAFDERFPDYHERMGRQFVSDIWDISWAAAIAAHSYVWEGRTKPRGQ